MTFSPLLTYQFFSAAVRSDFPDPAVPVTNTRFMSAPASQFPWTHGRPYASTNLPNLGFHRSGDLHCGPVGQLGVVPHDRYVQLDSRNSLPYPPRVRLDVSAGMSAKFFLNDWSQRRLKHSLEFEGQVLSMKLPQLLLDFRLDRLSEDTAHLHRNTRQAIDCRAADN